jgi:hypothetical protein
MDKDYLLLKRAALSRPSGEWNDDDFDVLANGVVVGRIFKATPRRSGSHGCGRSPSGITAMPPHAKPPWMEAFAKSWRRE